MRRAIELANSGGTWIHGEYLLGDAHMMRTIPVEQTDCSTAIDKAIDSWKKQ